MAIFENLKTKLISLICIPISFLFGLQGCSSFIQDRTYPITFKGQAIFGNGQHDSTYVIVAGWGGDEPFNSRGEPHFHTTIDSSGVFFITVYSKTYEDGEGVNRDSVHLDVAPLIVIIKKSNATVFQNQYSIDDLRKMEKVTPEVAARKISKDGFGIWLLPDVKLEN